MSENTETLTNLTPFQTLDSGQGMVCDVETGICGPIAEDKEEKN